MEGQIALMRLMKSDVLSLVGFKIHHQFVNFIQDTQSHSISLELDRIGISMTTTKENFLFLEADQ